MLINALHHSSDGIREKNHDHLDEIYHTVLIKVEIIQKEWKYNSYMVKNTRGQIEHRVHDIKLSNKTQMSSIISYDLTLFYKYVSEIKYKEEKLLKSRFKNQLLKSVS